MRQLSLITALLIPLLISPTVIAKDEISSHTTITQALVELLSQTELCLRSCQTSEHIEKEMSILQNLKQRAEEISRKQQQLPEPSEQDYLAAQMYAKDFNTLWKAIQEHIARLEKEKLMTDELREVLGIAPSPTSEEDPH